MEFFFSSIYTKRLSSPSILLIASYIALLTLAFEFWGSIHRVHFNPEPSLACSSFYQTF